MELYFDLKSMRSYKVSGYSGKRYAFYKGRPVLVTDPLDIKKFTDHSDIFFQCDVNGNAIVIAPTQVENKKYVKFKANLQNIIEKAEEMQKQAAEAKRQIIDTDELLKLASQDSFKKDEDENDEEDGEENLEEHIEDGLEEHIEEEYIEEKHEDSKEFSKKLLKPIKKKNPLECEQCGQILKSKKDLEKHLADHEDEE